MSVTKGVGSLDAIVYANCQFAVLPLSTNTFDGSIYDVKLLNEELHDHEDCLDKLRIDVDDRKPSEDEPEDEPAEPEIVKKMPVWCRGSCSHSNSRFAAFNRPHKMTPNDAFKPHGVNSSSTIQESI